MQYNKKKNIRCFCRNFLEAIAAEAREKLKQSQNVTQLSSIFQPRPALCFCGKACNMCSILFTNSIITSQIKLDLSISH